MISSDKERSRRLVSTVAPMDASQTSAPQKRGPRSHQHNGPNSNFCPRGLLNFLNFVSWCEPTTTPVALFNVKTKSPTPYRDLFVHSLKRVNRKGMSPPLIAITRRSPWPTTPSSRYVLNCFAFASSEFRIRITYCLIGTSTTFPCSNGGTESGLPACPSVTQTASIQTHLSAKFRRTSGPRSRFRYSTVSPARIRDTVRYISNQR